MRPVAIILGANFYTALGAIRSLGRKGVEVYALDYHFPTAYALASRYVKEKILCPDINTAEQELADFLVEFGRTFNEKPVLLATGDSYALMISRNADLFRNYYLFPAMPDGLLEQIIDKKGLHELAVKHNLQEPKTYLVGPDTDPEEIAAAMPYPCIIKPALSHKFVKVFRKKCLFADNREELLAALKVAHESRLEVMVQEVIPGFDDQMYVYDIYVNREGRATHSLTAQKLRQFPINFGSSTLTHHLHDEQLAAIGLDYMMRLNYRGYGEIEFKRHPKNGEFYLIEINARLSTLNILFDKCGVEFTYAMYCDLIGEPLPDYHLITEQPWAFWHAYEDLISIIGYLKTKQLTFGQIIKPWLSHRKAHAILAADDLMPLVAFARVLLGKATGKIIRVIRGDRKTG
jgi:D-aspartate ligase